MAVGAAEVIQSEIETAHAFIRHALQARAASKPGPVAYLRQRELTCDCKGDGHDISRARPSPLQLLASTWDDANRCAG